ncbi:MAG: hypothetical protein A2075_18925 [Geobacteraceae bacterium GWC2_58_44]|nr:MAG: hypothetical protein A2075_18925 [Geobacteraceae bacterium GWC2_58_44]HBG07882.1 hypothetical protein [Geobacter sp.]
MFSKTVWSYLVVTAFLAISMRVAGDHWWPATLLLFGPRWIILLPLLLLIPLAVWYHAKLLIPLVIASLLMFSLFAGFNLPFNKVLSNTPEKPALRVITCNIQSGNFDLSRLSSLISKSEADVVALQECSQQAKLPLPEGWQLIREGELAVMSRYPLRSQRTLQTLHPPHKWPRTSLLSCVISVPGGDVAFCAVHLPSPRYGLMNMLDRKLLLNFSRSGLLVRETAHRLQAARDAQRAIEALDLPVIVAGDFNMPVESSIYRECWSGYRNAFSSLGLGFGWTERVDVRGIPLAARIDHVLTGEGLVPRTCQVGPDIGSDHLPVLADIARMRRASSAGTPPNRKKRFRTAGK